uniref:Cytosol aminopeptidase domain-containing protein n=1 Tax=Graphocephala atropunctata TaxID=36148 RepID=A0A1B6MGM0_9HEMI
MIHLFFTSYLVVFLNVVFGVHIFELDYRVTPEPTLTSPDYDGYVFVYRFPPNDSTIPAPIRERLMRESDWTDDASLVDVALPAKRLVYAPVREASDFRSVKKFGEAVKKAMKRALDNGIKAPLLVLHPDPNPNIPHAELVTLLGALDTFFVKPQEREINSPRGKFLGVWGPDYSTLIDIVNIATNLEDGRVVARDVAEATSEIMSPTKFEDYLRDVFPPESGVNISVVADSQILQKDFPFFAMGANRDGNGADTHARRIVFLTYDTPAPVVDTVLLVGEGAIYNSPGASSNAKVGAAAIAGFMKVLSDTGVRGLKVVAALALSRNTAEELPKEAVGARSGKRVRVTDNEGKGRMVLADIMCYLKELVKKKEAVVNPRIISIASGSEQGFVMDNGPAAKAEEGQILKNNSVKIGEPLEARVLKKDDFTNLKEGDVLVYKKDTQGPAAFLAVASGLDEHGLDSQLPIKYSHLDVPASVAGAASAVLTLANRYILRLEDPAEPGWH